MDEPTGTRTEPRPSERQTRGKHPLVWFQIPVTDLARAAEFYKTVFRWETRPLPGAPVWLIDAGDGIEGGFVLGPVHRPPVEGLTFYVRVPDVEAAIVRATRAGGSIERVPQYLGVELGISASIRDPDGNVVGLWCEE